MTHFITLKNSFFFTSVSKLRTIIQTLICSIAVKQFHGNFFVVIHSLVFVTIAMADRGKAKSPGSEVKKGQEGSSKKRRKNRKSTETAGDGAPSPAPVSLSASQSSAVTTQQSRQPEGATAAVNGEAKQESSSSGKNLAKGGEKVLKTSEPVEKVMPNRTGKNEAAEKEILGDGNKGGDDGAHEKCLSKKETKANKQQKPNSAKHETAISKSSTPNTDKSKQRKDDELSRTETPKHIEHSGQSRGTSETEIQVQSDKDKKSNETPTSGGSQQKSMLFFALIFYSDIEFV